MGRSSYIASEQNLLHVCDEICNHVKQRKKVQVIVTAVGRSLSQNAFSHALYRQMAQELPEDDADGWKCYCKLQHGVPILRAEDEEYREMYDNVIKSRSYEEQLQIMRYWPVTSLMNKTQFNKYIESLQDDFFKRGVTLRMPEDR